MDPWSHDKSGRTRADGADPFPRRPPIVVSFGDRRVLERAAVDGLLRAPRFAGALLDEILRAQVVADVEIGPDIVRLGSRVTFRQGFDGGLRTVRLAGPDERCDTPDEVSVLTSIGTALLGLRAGQSILWPDRLGGEQLLTVVAVGDSGCGR
jgi:regulator of nucleoside diphosphate kinase